MILASAQTRPKRGDINSNLNDHYRLIEKASHQGADLIVFPELSITGYEREEAHKMAFTENDTRLGNLKKLAVDNKIIIIVGAPIKINVDLFVGAFIFYPDSSVSIYTKQFLHQGEEEYYQSSFNYNPVINVGNDRIALAICADICNPLHPENASKAGCTIYMPGIFFTPEGIPTAHTLLSSYAKKYSMKVLMSNYGGQSWGRESGGRSAFWNDKGDLIIEMNDSGSGLIIVEKNNEIWKGQVYEDN